MAETAPLPVQVCFHQVCQAQGRHRELQLFLKAQVDTGKQLLLRVKEGADCAHRQGPVVLSTSHKDAAAPQELLLLQTDQVEGRVLHSSLEVRHRRFLKHRRELEDFTEILDPPDPCEKTPPLKISSS